ncbi:MAG: hypothetical protein MJE68_15400 [Proteobacteria bacterium]|nr:hypothetical protein [Pseudomonadota bacterium]
MDVDVPLEIIVDRSPVTLMANYVYAGISYGMMSGFLSFRQESRIYVYLESYKLFIYPRYTRTYIHAYIIIIKPALGLHVLKSMYMYM